MLALKYLTLFKYHYAQELTFSYLFQTEIYLLIEMRKSDLSIRIRVKTFNMNIIYSNAKTYPELMKIKTAK